MIVLSLICFFPAYMLLPKREASAAERALGRWDLVRGVRVDRNRGPQRARQSLEAGFGDMMIIAAVERHHMQGQAAVHGESLEPFAHQFGVEAADLVANELGLEHQNRPAGYVEGDTREGLVH